MSQTPDHGAFAIRKGIKESLRMSALIVSESKPLQSSLDAGDASWCFRSSGSCSTPSGHDSLCWFAQGCSPAAKDTEGRTALHHAVMRGHLGCVDLLLNAGPPGLLLVRDILGCTPVHLAALQNQVALITRLANALLRDGGGATPLHEVARRRCMQVGTRQHHAQHKQAQHQALRVF